MKAGPSPGVGPLIQRLGATLVVAGDPLLDSASATAEGLSDRGGGAALGGKDDGLVADPDPFAGYRLGDALEVVEGEMVVGVHNEAPGVGPNSLILLDRRRQRNSYVPNSREAYYS